MEKLNCWEVKKCGRWPGGSNVDGRGPCPVTTRVPATGINNGVCGGRLCWAMDRTISDQNGSRSFPEKLRTCQNCSFYVQVRYEEGNSFVTISEIGLERKGDSVF